MDIFSHLFVVRIAMFALKDDNKRQRGRGWPILKTILPDIKHTYWGLPNQSIIFLPIRVHYFSKAQ